jgi:hypothetical protein
MFSPAQRHKLSQGEHTLQVFKVELTELQLLPLTLLGVSGHAFRLESQRAKTRHCASSTCGM